MLEAVISLDYSIEAILENLYNPGPFSFFLFITKLGGTAVIVLVSAYIVYCLWRKKDKEPAKRFVAFFLLNELSVFFIKWFINRPRPFAASILGEVDGSFPSGHAASIFVYGFLIYYIPKTKFKRKKIIRLSLGVLVVLIGVSRLYLNVHYFSDVIFGYLVGLTFLTFLLRSKK
ncbi:MAG: phosphatase PAP2 family protein [Candidatus Vogelbacteria bacterium]|nr:phosphatase PAP2 family protein [Candidatus Vogelbacteria bacterium]